MNQSLADQLATTMLYGGNASFIEDLYEQFLRDPATVESAWRTYFAALSAGSKGEVAHGPIRDQVTARTAQRAGAGSRNGASSDESGAKQGAVSRLIQVYAYRGHLNAKLDPLGMQQMTKRYVLEPAYFGLTDADMEREFFTGSRTPELPKRATLRTILATLTQIYMDTIGAEFAHVSDTEERRWLQDHFQSSQIGRKFSVDEKKNILWQVTAAEVSRGHAIL